LDEFEGKVGVVFYKGFIGDCWVDWRMKFVKI